jgi:Concanavalin A-like lectin/glucanases superfamily
MARSFNGTSQAIQSQSTVNLSGTSIITASFWLWWNAFANDDELAAETSANYNSSNGAILIDPNSSTSSAFDVNIHTGSGYTSGHFPRPSAAVWHHYAIIFNTSALAQVWVDGVSQTVTSSSGAGTGNFGNLTLNLMSRNSSTLWAAGRMADFAIFNRALSTSEILSLASQQITPISLDNGALAVNYKFNEQTPLQDLSQNQNFGTTTGNPVVVDGPPNSQRRRRKFWGSSVAGRAYTFYIAAEKII